MHTIAREVGFPYRKLCDITKARSGLTPNDYLLKLRIDEAKRRLCHGADQSVTDLAFDLGFSSSQYFSTVFKKFTGLTPSQYRAQP